MEGHLVCSATQTIGLLAFIYLFYTQSFGFDPIKLYSGTRDLLKNATMEEVGGLEDNLQPLFKSFIVPTTTTTNYNKICNYNYTIPAVVFSSGGFVGNLFHEFNEIIIPLYITSRVFKSQVQFILVDYNPSLVKKYERIFSSLSRYNVLNPMMNMSVHCFPGAVVGLKSHGFLGINSSEVPKGNSMIEFRKFLGIAYGLKITNVSNTAPRLLLVSRRKTRSFLNEDELVDMMEELGFDVVVVRSPKKMSNLERFAKLVSTCSVLVGAHGAGLTNQVFLPTGAVVVQVVPLGLEWPSSVYFGEPAVRMGLHYLDYKIGPYESSLIDMYAHDDPVILDPGSVFAKGYNIGKEMYLDKQNIRVDVNRFKGTLVE
ncbi:hypothetical protein M8C21_008256, partial [Ambrosia artemisiifolia]